MPHKLLAHLNVGLRIRRWDAKEESCRYWHVSVGHEDQRVLLSCALDISRRSNIWQDSLKDDADFAPFMRAVSCRRWADDPCNSALSEEVLYQGRGTGAVATYYTTPVARAIASRVFRGKMYAMAEQSSYFTNRVDEGIRRWIENPAWRQEFIDAVDVLTEAHAEWFKAWYEVEFYKQNRAPGYSLPDFYIYTLFEEEPFKPLWEKLLDLVQTHGRIDWVSLEEDIR